MLKSYNLIKICLIFLFVILGFVILSNKEKVYGYDCRALGLYCSAPIGGTVGGGKVYNLTCLEWEYVCDPVCHSVCKFDKRICSEYTYRGYPCSGTDTNCSGGKYYYLDSTCSGPVYFEGCCISTRPCTPKTSCSCTSPLSSSNQGNGSKTVSCSDGCGGTASSTCYCPAGSCSALDPIWLDTEPSPPFRSYTLTVPVTTTVSGCPTTDEKTCYTTNQYPELESIQILPVDEGSVGASLPSSVKKIFTKIVNIVNAQTFTEDIMGYTSDFSSGKDLNNPVQVVAKYSDPDGTSDIQAVYVWWDDSGIKDFTTPTKIADLDPQALENSFGLMVTVDGNVYVPHIDGSTATWKLVGTTSSESISITGPSNSMITLSNISIDDDGSFITLTTNMEFLKGSGDDIVDTHNYNLWGMANDYAGFTEFEEDGNIKDNDIWEDSGTDWTLDMVDPVINPPSTSNGDDQLINLSFTSSDDYQISFVRVDACYGDNNNPKTIYGDDGSSYTMPSCNDMGTYFDTIDISSNSGLISSSPVSIGNQDIEININGNDNGSITFYITTMDMAGNYDQKFVIYKLGDWAAVQDGFVFGKSGVTSSTRVLENDWDSNSEIKDSGYTNFTYDTVDLTNDVLLGGSTSDIAFLGTLEKYDINHSFKASKYSGASVNAVYSELTMAYELKKRNISYIEDEQTTLNVSLSSYCDGGEPYDFCIIKNSGNINIESDFECDTKGLIISGGDINISPDMTNSSTSSDSACIILAKNDINIDQGSSKSDADVNYDIIQAFMIAGNDINIDSDSTNNGLLVEGGLFGFGTENGSSILNSRSIVWGFRNQYPVIVVNNNAKYGLLSKDIFGSQVEIFKLEIGFKPY